jgi:hypothetical protein
MRTEELVNLLSTGSEPVERGQSTRRFATSVPLALFGAYLLMRIVFGLRPDLSSAMTTGLFWAKLALPVCIALGALLATIRLSRPGANVGSAWLVLSLPVTGVWLAGALIVATAPEQDRASLILGMSWRSCPFNILLLSVPAFFAIFIAVKSLAATRLSLAGASAGLLSGSVATIAYCFHCPEMSPAFWGIWYVLGMSLVAVVGAIAGPRLLRW